MSILRLLKYEFLARTNGLASPVNVSISNRGFFSGCMNRDSTLWENNPGFPNVHGFRGIGTFYSSYDGAQYKGRWENNILGSPSGKKAVMLLKNNDLYIGELSNEFLPEGTGKLIFSESNHFNVRYPVLSQSLRKFEKPPLY